MELTEILQAVNIVFTIASKMVTRKVHTFFFIAQYWYKIDTHMPHEGKSKQ